MLILFEHICKTKYIFRAPPTSWRSSIVFGVSLRLSVRMSVCLSQCPSVCPSAVVITLTQSFLIRIFPNSKYGLLSLNSCSSSSMFFFLTNDNQNGWQNGHCLSVCIYCGHSNLVILIGVLPNFIYGLLT